MSAAMRLLCVAAAWLAAFPAFAQSVNVAAAANGGVATASSTYSSAFPASAVINGDRKGLNWGNGGGWNDGTTDAFPDWLQVNFNGVQRIGEIDVFTLQDNYGAPADPTPTMTFTFYGLIAFEVQYWNGSAWADVTGGNVTGNNLVWRRFTFAPISTDRIRVLVNNAAASYSRITEVEAWTAGPYATLSAPANNTMLAAGATVNLSATAADSAGPLGKVEFYRDATLIATVTSPSSGTTTSGTYTASDTNVAAGSYRYTAKAYDGADPTMTSTSASVLVSVTAATAASMNVAASVNGGIATASSTYSSGYPPAAAIDGDRKGLNPGAGGIWTDATLNVFPDWLQVNFSAAQSIGEIDLFTQQDNYASPLDPTPAMTFTQWGLTAFQVQYWTGSAWADVPAGNVTSNNFIWRRFAFIPISTDRIRVLANNGGASGDYSRIVELEAWTVPAYRISGTVSSGGAPLAGIAVAASNGAACTATDSSGQYRCTAPQGWSGSVTPAVGAYNFTPASRSYSAVQADQAAQDYAATLATYSVSGTVSSGGAPLAGIALAASAGATCTASDAAGHYSCSAPYRWSGSVAPLGGYSFTPVSRSYSGLQADQAGQDFAGVGSTMSISYILVDHLDTPRVITDSAGNLVWQWDDTEPFGDSVPNDDPNSTGSHFDFPLGLSLYYTDKETGQRYAQLRDCYDPITGRFCQSDPIGLAGGINTYLYVDGSPLQKVDPEGDAGVVAVGGFGGGAGTIGAAGAGLAVVGAFIGGYAVGTAVYDEFGDSIVDLLILAKRGRWTCTAKCAHTAIPPNNCCEPPFLTGSGSGHSQEAACRAAKRAATTSASPGCYGSIVAVLLAGKTNDQERENL